MEQVQEVQAEDSIINTALCLIVNSPVQEAVAELRWEAEAEVPMEQVQEVQAEESMIDTIHSDRKLTGPGGGGGAPLGGGGGGPDGAGPGGPG